MLCQLLRCGAGEVGLVRAEHTRHVLLSHAQELLRCVVFVRLRPEGFLDEETLAAHGLVLLTTYYLQLATYNLLLTAYYLVLTAYYLLPTTYYLLLTTYYLLFSFWKAKVASFFRSRLLNFFGFSCFLPIG